MAIMTEAERREVVNKAREAVTGAEAELNFIEGLVRMIGKYPEQGTISDWLKILTKKIETIEALIIKLQVNGNARKELKDGKRE